jgi:hypothetical protein
MKTSKSTDSRPVVSRGWTELASRQTDGLAVTLLWSKTSNGVKVSVADEQLDEAFEVEVAGADALAAFYHPFAYASQTPHNVRHEPLVSRR